MSPALHPHWHTTDNDEIAVPVRTQTNNEIPERRYAVRHPAAIVGILLVLGLGTFFVQGIRELRGQVGSTPVIVRITGQGLDPKAVSVLPGQTIVWRNESDIPHILTSDALPVEGGTLYTPHILPASEFSTRIVPDTTPGSFTYVSLTAEDIVGTITVISAPAKPATVNRPPLVQSPILPSPTPTPIPSGSMRPLAPLASIPRNPYALEASPPSFGTIPQVPSNGIPVTSPIPPLAATVRPFAQPETGPRGIAATLIMSVMGVVALCIRLNKNKEIS